MATRQQLPSTGEIFRATLTVFAAVLLIYAAYRVRSILVLAFVAAFLAVGLDPLVRALERKGMRRGFSVTLIFFGAIIFIVAFIAAVVPPLVGQVTNFATNLPDYVSNLAKDNPRIHEFVVDNNISQRLQDATRQVPSLISGSLGRVVGVAGSIVGAFFNLFTVMVLTIYFSLSLGRIREGTMKLVPKSRRDRVSRLVDPILEKIGGYIAGNVAVSLIAGLLAFGFMAIARVPFPLALALWVAIADLIPLVGATLGAVPAVIVAFFTSIPQGIATLAFFVIYQQVENYVIAPRVMTKAVDISPAAVLIAALIGAGLLGFVGALIAIPAAAAVKLLTQEVAIPMAESG